MDKQYILNYLKSQQEKDKKLSIFTYLKLISDLENHLHKKVDLVREQTLKPQIKEYIYQDLTYV